MVQHYEIEELETLKLDIDKLRSDLADLAQRLADAGKSEVEESKDKANNQVEKIRQVFDETRERSKRIAESVQQKVGERLGKATWAGLVELEAVQQKAGERPYVSLTLLAIFALGVGFFLAKFID
jgi:ElaB/YqjD/DUF883 family membrane-anchored ribosome-binding protein